MIAPATDLLVPFWGGALAHLWQTTVFLALIWLLSRVLRRSSARLLGGLYWIGVAKLLLPLPLLAPWAERLLIAAGGGGASPGQAVWVAVQVWFYPGALRPLPGRDGAESAGLALLATLIWVAGALIAWSAIWRGGRRSAGTRRGRENRELHPELRAAARAAGLSLGAVRLGDDAERAPLVRGWLRPVVVVPPAILRALDADELRAVLLHEREHATRRDPLRYGLLALVRGLFWFYPPIAWLSRRIHETTEMACDDAVTSAGVPAGDYCRSLARVIRLGLDPRQAVSLFGDPARQASALQRRLTRIRAGRRFEAMPSHRMLVFLAAFAAVAVSLLPLPPALAGPPALAAEQPENGLDRLADAEIPVMLTFRQAPLAMVLEAISAATGGGVSFEISEELSARSVTIETPRTALADALLQLGEAARLHFRALDPRTVEVSEVFLAGEDGVTNPVLIRESKTIPAYPAEAREQRIAGRVLLQATIDRTGAVRDLTVLRSEPRGFEPFIESATSAVRHWRYEPATRDGQPVDAYFTLEIKYSLNGSGGKEAGSI